ncbi:MAG TPA: triose-phosphate isomerase [Spirochaetota bacterium]|nr:triose-phosphate isomerase [Spirochaetota bacterium]
MRTPMIAGNWKMNMTVPQAEELARAIQAGFRGESGRDVLVCPPAVCLETVRRIIGTARIRLGAQTVHPEGSGAYTGEVALDMLRSAGCDHVIIGHSERRAIFGETDTQVARRMRAVLNGRLVPVLCVGETLAERKAGRAEEVVARQVSAAYAGVGTSDALVSVIAYEPVWAIGTGETATPEQADAMHASIRRILGKLYGEQVADSVRILYGGSVNEKNIDELMRRPNIDGALVGGASLKPESFLRIVHYQ